MTHGFPFLAQFGCEFEDVFCDFVSQLFRDAFMLTGQIVDFREKTVKSEMKTELGVFMLLFRQKVVYEFPELMKKK